MEEPIAWERRPGDACASLPSSYERRRPEATPLHRAVRSHLETFLQQARDRSEHGFGLPRFVEKEFSRYLACGVLARGFARVRCSTCGHDMLVAFSCKTRGVCPSCTTRRAHDTAAHLVDHVLPAVPLRQWVLTFPRAVRFELARRPELVSPVLAIFLRALFTWQRKRARGVDGRGGAITFLQRFGSALQLNVHMHVISMDGVFVDDEGTARFVRLPPPDDDDVMVLLRRTARRVARLLHRRDRGDASQDALAALSADNLDAGAAAGEPRSRRLTAFLEGFSLHVATVVHEHDRAARERLCFYGARGALALSRLRELPDGRLCYRLRRPQRNGATELHLTGVELLQKLAPLIPPPRQNLTRFHGVFAGNARLRAAVVAGARPAPALVEKPPPRPPPSASAVRSPYRIDWAALLKRVFDIDVLECRRCHGRLAVVAFITDADATARILRHLGLPDEPPPLERARGPPQAELDL
jgi:hypothetical protein